MNVSTLLLPALLALSVTPAYAQCCGGHSSHGETSNALDHSAHQGKTPRVRASNTICPVMGEAVKPVNDQEVDIRGNHFLVCCDGCGQELTEHYDKYIDQDGAPRNEPKADPRKDPDKPAPASSTHEGHQH
jgi:hypothetical protein